MRITLEINDNRLDAFLDLIKTLDYVSIKGEEEAIPQWQQDEVIRRLELIRSGEMETRSWEEAKKELFKK